MKFFKHFTDAHEGKSMMALMSQFGVEGYGAFFILTELCAKKLEKHADQEFTEEHLKFTFNERLVREKLRMRSTKVELFLNSCATLDLLLFTKVEDEFNFYFPKLLESMDRDTKRARQDRAMPAPKKKKKNKEEEIDKEEEEEKPPNAVTSFLQPETFIKEFMEKVSIEVQKGWLATFQDADWIIFELKKAVNHILADPAKGPKSQYGRYFTSWLSRGWEWKRKSHSGKPAANVDPFAFFQDPKYQVAK